MNESTAHTDPSDVTSARYLRPTWFTRNVFNRLVRWLTRRGFSLAGSRELRIVGRRSGEVRTTVVNLLPLDGRRYLVAPRGTTEWVRNLRAAGTGEIRVGRRVEAFQADELADDAKVPVLARLLGPLGLGGRPVLRGHQQGVHRRRPGRHRPRLPRLRHRTHIRLTR